MRLGTLGRSLQPPHLGPAAYARASYEGLKETELELASMTDISEETAPVPTAASIGKWLFDEIQKKSPQYLYQSDAVAYIKHNFGKEWSYQNENGNPAISKEVIKEFGKLKLTDPNIQWHSGSQCWQRMPQEQFERHMAQKAAQKLRNDENKRIRAEREEKNKKLKEERESKH